MTMATQAITDKGWTITANSQEVKRQMFSEMLRLARAFRRTEPPMSWHTIHMYLSGMRRATFIFLFHDWEAK